MDPSNWIGRAARGLCDFVGRLAGETRGNVALLFGLSLPVLILMTVGGVDIHRASTVRVSAVVVQPVSISVAPRRAAARVAVVLFMR